MARSTSQLEMGRIFGRSIRDVSLFLRQSLDFHSGSNNLGLKIQLHISSCGHIDILTSRVDEPCKLSLSYFYVKISLKHLIPNNIQRLLETN